MYSEKQWTLSPMNAKNNVNSIGDIPRTDLYTLDKNGALLAVQENLVRKLVTELNTFDNLFFEIANEPYFGGITMDWQHRIADVISDTEKSLPNKHLIAQNIANKTAKIENPHPAVSIFNFHYATPPEAVTTNYGLNKVIGDDETGFRGNADAAYRTEAWAFILAGGGLYNNLDYSFTTGHEDGTFNYPPTQPGGGNTSFRKQIRILSEFLHGLDFIHMKPDTTVIAGGVPPNTDARALVDPDKAIAAYLHGDRVTTLQLPPGTWQGHWVDTKSGTTTPIPPTPGSTTATLIPPAYQTDIALRLQKN